MVLALVGKLKLPKSIENQSLLLKRCGIEIAGYRLIIKFEKTIK